MPPRAKSKSGASASSASSASSAGSGGIGHDVVAIARGLAEVVAEHNLSELVIDTPTATLTLRRGVAGAPVQVAMAPMAPPPVPVSIAAPSIFAAPAAAPAVAAAASGAAGAGAADNAHVVTSPFVGTFYRKPNPDSANYVQLGDRVDKGQVLCIVEAMKLMNEIEADAAGTISAILVEDGATVEYGQALFKIS